MMPIWDFSWQKWNDVIVVSRTSLKNVVRKTFQMRQQAWIRKRTWSQRDVSSWSARLWWCDCDEMPRRCQIDDLLGVMSIYCYSTISCTSLSFLIWKLQQFFFWRKVRGDFWVMRNAYEPAMLAFGSKLLHTTAFFSVVKFFPSQVMVRYGMEKSDWIYPDLPVMKKPTKTYLEPDGLPFINGGLSIGWWVIWISLHIRNGSWTISIL